MTSASHMLTPYQKVMHCIGAAMSTVCACDVTSVEVESIRPGVVNVTLNMRKQSSVVITTAVPSDAWLSFAYGVSP